MGLLPDLHVTASWLPPEQAAAIWSAGERENEEADYQAIAFDPGGTTGWALFQVHPEAMGGDPDFRVLDNIEWWTAGEFTGNLDDQCDQALELITAWPRARLVAEDFVLRQMNADLAPVEMNAKMRWAFRPRYFSLQQASLAMSTVTDERQKSWGFWIPGKPHARDGVKHAITFLKRRKEAAVKELLVIRRAGG